MANNQLNELARHALPSDVAKRLTDTFGSITIAASFVGMGETTLRKWIKRGYVPSHQKQRFERLLNPYENTLTYK